MPSIDLANLAGKQLAEDIVLTSFIAEGGMGCTYKAWQSSLNRNLCVKILRAELATENQRAVKRFFREARILASLDFADVVRVYSVGLFQDCYPFIAMELIEGPSLRELISSQLIDCDRALAITINICNALSKVHQSGIRHRDLKPENIVLVGQNSEQVKLIDFGLGGESVKSTVTLTDNIIGTPNYMPPEAFSSVHRDETVDIYAIGCILYELLSGKMLFEDANIFSIVSAKTSGRKLPPLPEQCCPGKRRERLNQVILKCCAREPKDRFSDCKQLSLVLSQISCLDVDEDELTVLLNDRSKKQGWKTMMLCAAALAVLAFSLSQRQQKLTSEDARPPGVRAKARLNWHAEARRILQEAESEHVSKEKLLVLLSSIDRICSSVSADQVALKVELRIVASKIAGCIYNVDRDAIWLSCVNEQLLQAQRLLEANLVTEGRVVSYVETLLAENSLAKGLEKEAVEHLERAHRLWSTQTGNDPVLDKECPGATLRDEHDVFVLRRLAEILESNGNKARARTLYWESIKESKRVSGRLRADPFIALSGIVRIEAGEGHFELAEKLILDAEQTIIREQNKSKLETADSADFLAILSESALTINQPDLALRLLENSVEQSDATMTASELHSVERRVVGLTTYAKTKCHRIYSQCLELSSRVHAIDPR